MITKKVKFNLDANQVFLFEAPSKRNLNKLNIILEEDEHSEKTAKYALLDSKILVVSESRIESKIENKKIRERRTDTDFMQGGYTGTKAATILGS